MFEWSLIDVLAVLPCGNIERLGMLGSEKAGVQASLALAGRACTPAFVRDRYDDECCD
jgi:hypothetical protein